MLRFGCADMSDGDFLRSFQDKGIPASQFHHGDHLRLGWLLLERLSVDDATDAACRGLRAFAHRNGADTHYNETLTRGWMRLLAARGERSFSDFVATLPDAGAADSSVAPSENPLHRHWSPELLKDDAARVAYVEPDREPLPPVHTRWRSTVAKRPRSNRLTVDGPSPDERPASAAGAAIDEEPDPENALDGAKTYLWQESRKLQERLQSPLRRDSSGHGAPLHATSDAAKRYTDTRHGNQPMSSGFTWTSAFGKGSGWLLQKIVNGLALSKISPNTLTFIGLIINIIAAFFFGYARGENAHRMFFYAGLILIGAGLFDMVDGRVARQTNQVSVFGAFFDSVMDRYSDVAIFFGLLVYYARGNRFVYVVLAAFVMTASLMISYTRARAEALIGSCKVGFMERPERIVLVILGALCNRWGVMAPALWVLAFLGTMTVIHRIRYTYTETERRKLVPAAR
jgi:CDP-diacylglycerol--glycerol-3-phosphate 3-phosphatidyltransferase